VPESVCAGWCAVDGLGCRVATGRNSSSTFHLHLKTHMTCSPPPSLPSQAPSSLTPGQALPPDLFRHWSAALSLPPIPRTSRCPGQFSSLLTPRRWRSGSQPRLQTTAQVPTRPM
jgi:hypothetical protein